jgi:thiamine biosynthesis lipoprotein
MGFIIAKKKSFCVIWILVFYSTTLFHCSKPSPQSADVHPLTLSGSTMGTYYRVTIASPPASLELEKLKTEITELLVEINAQMSTYISDSELSRFNDYKMTDWFPVSFETAMVVAEGIKIHQLTEGAFDITVGPLVNLWGFGPPGKSEDIPTVKQISESLKKVGSNHLKSRLSPPALKKEIVDLYVDLSGIAKGFGVDSIANLLETQGLMNYIVDIGGEMKTRGRKNANSPWRIAIESPIVDKKEIQQVINLNDQAIATSGDYRNYFEKDGKRYSHEINPRTGYPIQHRLASVTVLDSSCMRADALATALIVLGPEKGFQLAEKESNAALFIIKGEDGFFEKETTKFKREYYDKE